MLSGLHGIPVSTVHAGCNPRYLGRQRGSTLYTWMADTHAPFHQTLIPGTERDSLYALDGLMANETVLRPRHRVADPADAARLTPLGHPTINLHGRFRTTTRAPSMGLRPLRSGQRGESR